MSKIRNRKKLFAKAPALRQIPHELTDDEVVVALAEEPNVGLVYDVVPADLICTTTESNWILVHGYWRDTGIWEDDAVWNDGNI